MAKATNKQEILKQIDQWIKVAASLVSAKNLVLQVVNQDKAVGQTWRDLAIDFEDLNGDEGAVLNQTFTPEEVQKVENHAKEFLRFCDGSGGTIDASVDRERIFRKLSGVV